MPSYKTAIASAAMIAMGYLANPNTVYSQFAKPQATQKSASVQDTIKKTQTLQNRILSKDQSWTFSATGEGIFLKNFVYSLNIDSNSNCDLEGMLSAVKGDVHYEVMGAKKGLENTLSYLRKIKNQTGEQKASMRYMEGLLKNTEESDSQSVRLLGKSLQDRVIAPQQDSLFVNGEWQIKEGRYIIMARSETKTFGGVKYVANSVPILVDVRTNSLNVAERKNIASFAPFTKPYATADSTAKAREEKERLAKARADSIVKVEARKQIQTSIVKKYVSEDIKLKTRFGLESAFGTNQEGIVGAFVGVPLDKTVNVEAYGNFYFAKGKPISSTSVTDTTFREVELIGPGTYKQRTDEITTITEDKARAEFGAGLSYKISEGLEIPVRAGVVFSKGEETIEGKSTITHERNQLPLGNPEVITNSKKGEGSNSKKFSLSLGALYNLNRNFSVGASFNRVGEANSGRINLRYRF